VEGQAGSQHVTSVNKYNPVETRVSTNDSFYINIKDNINMNYINVVNFEVS
jgi:hypothetical protein